MDVGNRYRLTKELGKGGMGAVWLAIDRVTQSEVAIKFVSNDTQPEEEQLRRFEREALLLKKLSHPHIVRVQETGVAQDGRLYIVMELVVGMTLAKYLKAKGRLSLEETATLLRQLASGLDHAHEKEIIHRDLKPANIMIVTGSNKAKLIDFGLAKRTVDQSELTQKGRDAMGTINYMAPEQYMAPERVDRRCDLWALGAIAFRAVTGKMAFPGSEWPQVFARVCHSSAPSASSAAPELGLSNEVDRFFQRAFDKDPALRFQSAKELAEAFECATNLLSQTRYSDDDSALDTVIAPSLEQEESTAPVRQRTKEQGGDFTVAQISEDDKSTLPARRSPKEQGEAVATAKTSEGDKGTALEGQSPPSTLPPPKPPPRSYTVLYVAVGVAAVLAVVRFNCTPSMTVTPIDTQSTTAPTVPVASASATATATAIVMTTATTPSATGTATAIPSAIATATPTATAKRRVPERPTPTATTNPKQRPPQETPPPVADTSPSASAAAAKPEYCNLFEGRPNYSASDSGRDCVPRQGPGFCCK